jgi:hypothetical protein
MRKLARSVCERQGIDMTLVRADFAKKWYSPY